MGDVVLPRRAGDNVDNQRGVCATIWICGMRMGCIVLLRSNDGSILFNRAEEVSD